MNKKTRCLSNEEKRLIINTIRDGGFKYIDSEGIERVFQPNYRISVILMVQASCGLRIGDILTMKLEYAVKDGDRYKFDFYEQKTDKHRNFTVPTELYNFLLEYCVSNGIKKTQKIFPLNAKTVQDALKRACLSLGLGDIGTHSFRKYAATKFYIATGYDIVATKEFLQHFSTKTTETYLGYNTETFEKALVSIVDIF